jgi:hypothetical protein
MDFLISIILICLAAVCRTLLGEEKIKREEFFSGLFVLNLLHWMYNFCGERYRK